MGNCEDCIHHPCFWVRVGIDREIANLCYDYIQGIEEADRMGLIESMPNKKIYIKGKKDGQKE